MQLLVNQLYFGNVLLSIKEIDCAPKEKKKQIFLRTIPSSLCYSSATADSITYAVNFWFGDQPLRGN